MSYNRAVMVLELRDAPVGTFFITQTDVLVKTAPGAMWYTDGVVDVGNRQTTMDLVRAFGDAGLVWSLS